MMCCSLSRMAAFVIGFSLLQCYGCVRYSRAGAQSISQLIVQDVNDGSNRRCNAKLVAICTEDLNVSSSRSIRPQSIEGLSNSSEFGTDDANYLSADERYDWCAGYALYRHTLEVNGVQKPQVAEWERSLRRYCTAKTEARDTGEVRWKGGAQGEPYNGDWRAIFDIDFIAQFQSRRVGYFNLENGKVAKSCKVIEFGYNFARKGFWVPNHGYSDVSIPSQGSLISDDMQRSKNPSIVRDNESRAVRTVSIDPHYSDAGIFTYADLSEWVWDILANCEASKRKHDQTTQPHGAFP
jgi:hypothetical protein